MSAPAKRWGGSIAFDSVRNVLVLFGGYDGSSLLNDTWEFSLSTLTWTQKTPAHAPSARTRAGFVYDPGAAKVLLFGGSNTDGSVLNSETWQWDGTDWTNLAPVTTPRPRPALGCMAYDPGRNITVMAGGLTDLGYSSDTWTWNGTNWTQVGGTSSPGFDLTSMAYDPISQQVIMFGGYGGGGDYANGTYGWNGSTWVNLAPASNPGGLASPCLCTTAVGLVLFGGNNGVLQDSTWTWNGTNWITANPPNTPPPLYLAGCCSANSIPYIVGGAISLNGSVMSRSIWKWDEGAQNWTTPGGLDESAPTVVSVVSTSDGKVTINWSVDVVFGGPAKPAAYPNDWKITPQNVLAGVPVEIQSISVSNSAITIQTSGLTNGQVYNVTVPSFGIFGSTSGLGYVADVNKTVTGVSTAPTVLQVSPVDSTHIDVTFSKPMNQGDCLSLNLYAADNGLQLLAVKPISAFTYRITTSEQAGGTSYHLTASGMRDLLNNPVA